ncbi:hypothetical protein [Tardiphaga sp. 813_E8_N1_3]|uniref:hypothetical protein n=1 Tax=Tardiphaga sp. 813_E8_N1_3 TaxID=3240760 RepID=UPI003F2804CB
MTDNHTATDDEAPAWRADVDALAFRPSGHRGLCMVHRHAFRTLLRRYPSPEECAAYFNDRRAVFQAAAGAKIVRASMAADANFHLTSRDLARAMQN